MDKEIEQLISITKQVALEQGCYQPMLFAYGDKGKAFSLLSEFPFDTHDQRRKAFFLVGSRFGYVKAVGSLTDVVFISEAWVGTNFGIQPSKDPKKTEVLLISHFVVKTQRSSVQMLQYIRDAKGTLVDLKDIPLPIKAEHEDNLAPAFVKGYFVSFHLSELRKLEEEIKPHKERTCQCHQTGDCTCSCEVEGSFSAEGWHCNRELQLQTEIDTLQLRRF